MIPWAPSVGSVVQQLCYVLETEWSWQWAKPRESSLLRCLGCCSLPPYSVPAQKLHKRSQSDQWHQKLRASDSVLELAPCTLHCSVSQNQKTLRHCAEKEGSMCTAGCLPSLFDASSVLWAIGGLQCFSCHHKVKRGEYIPFTYRMPLCYLPVTMMRC